MRRAPCRLTGAAKCSHNVLMDRKRIPRSPVLGDAVRDGWSLWVSCARCDHRAELDPAELAKRVGYDFAVAELKRRMRCSKCTSREIEVRIQPKGPGVVTRHG